MSEKLCLSEHFQQFNSEIETTQDKFWLSLIQNTITTHDLQKVVMAGRLVKATHATKYLAVIEMLRLRQEGRVPRPFGDIENPFIYGGSEYVEEDSL